MNHTNPNGTLPIAARTRTIAVGEGRVKVSELNWLDTFELLRLLSAHVGKVFDASGKFNLDPARVADAVVGAKEVSDFLVTHATGMPAEQLKDLSFVDGLAVLDAALEINLSPEIIGSLKKVAGRFAGAIGLRAAIPTAAASPAPATS